LAGGKCKLKENIANVGQCPTQADAGGFTKDKYSTIPHLRKDYAMYQL